MSYGYHFRPYVPVAQRRRNAEREMEKQRKNGSVASPVIIEGRAIASTFWGKAWCQNLERYSDYSNRIPRGRSYVRNGSVVDLKLSPGTAIARVAGSSLYAVEVKIAPVGHAQWQKICRDCAGGIDSLVELLQGHFSKAVMERVCEPGTGLFPAPSEITFECSCPDWASMCKHVAAVFYGIGARLDERPELLFRLRQVDESDLIARAASPRARGQGAPEPGLWRRGQGGRGRRGPKGPEAPGRGARRNSEPLWPLRLRRGSRHGPTDDEACPGPARPLPAGARHLRREGRERGQGPRDRPAGAREGRQEGRPARWEGDRALAGCGKHAPKEVAELVAFAASDRAPNAAARPGPTFACRPQERLGDRPAAEHTLRRGATRQ